MRTRSDRGFELGNEDTWWWLKRNSERVFNDTKTARSYCRVRRVRIGALPFL
jgi:hypothetical protein